MPTSGRQSVVDGLVAVLNTYKTANPTRLRRVYTARPGGFAELPAAYVGTLDEIILHTSGTRQRTFAPTVVVVDAFTDNEQTGDRMDILIDGLVDAYTAQPSVIVGMVLRQTGVLDGNLSISGPNDVTIVYRSATLTFADTVLMEGRN